MKAHHLYIPLIVGAFTQPGVVLVLETLSRRHAASITPSLSLAILTAICFVPIILTVAVFSFGYGIKGLRLECLFWGGFIAMWLMAAYIHFDVIKPIYFGGHMSSTASLAYVFAMPPLMFVAMLVGLVIGGFISQFTAFFDWLDRKLP